MSSTLIFKDNTDINLPYAISIGKKGRNKVSEIEKGTIMYNAELDRFEGYMGNIQPYNNTYIAPLSASIASETVLGGVKIGNNLTITTSGVLNAVAEYSSQKFQKILTISPVSGVGDYTNINNCLSNFFGFNSSTGEFSDGELFNLDRSDYPYPSSENRYIISLTPGQYNEDDIINLPPYVTLSGIDVDSVIINVNKTTMIKLLSNSNGNQIIQNVTFNINRTGDTDATKIIDLANTQNVKLTNIKFNNTILNGGELIFINCDSTTAAIFDNLKVVISGLNANDNNQNIIFIKAINTSLYTAKYCSVNISGYRGQKSLLYNSSGTTANLINCDFELTETNKVLSHTNNFCISENSELEMSYCTIKVNGYDLLLDNTTQECNGIKIENDTVKSSTTQSDITFIHYEDSTQYDEIICLKSNIDFSTLFNTNNIIKVTGATNTENNNVFTISNIYDEAIGDNLYSVIQITKSNHLKDEVVSSGSITIKSLYKTKINFSNINSVSNSIKCIDNNDYQYISLKNTNISGDKIVINNNKFIKETENKLTVGRIGCDFNNLYDALASINNSNTNNRYNIIMQSGIFYESKTLAIPDFVSLTGNNTTIIFNTNDSGYSNNIGLTIGNNNIISGIKFKQLNSLISDVTEDIIILGSNNLGVSESSAGNLSNLELLNCEFIVSSTELMANNFSCIKLLKTESKIKNLKITISCQDSVTASQNINALNLILGEHKINNPDITITGLNCENINTYGFNNDRTKTHINNLKLLNNVSGITSTVNYGILTNNTEESNINLVSQSEYVNILESGEIRVLNGTLNYSLYTDYNSSLLCNNLKLEGLTFNRNNNNNDYVNSLLRTNLTYQIITDNSDNIIGYQLMDRFGNSDIHTVKYGNQVGPLDYSSTAINNTYFGSNIGQLQESGSNNTLFGHNLLNSGSNCNNDIIIGVNTGNNLNDNLNIIIGNDTANNMVIGSNNNLLGSNSCSESNNISNIINLGNNNLISLTNSEKIISIGSNLASNLTSSNKNIIIGNDNINSLNEGNYNTIIGSEVSENVTNMNYTTIMGQNNINNVNEINSSTLIGSNIGSNVFNITNSLIAGNDLLMSTNISNYDYINDSVILGCNNTSNISSNISQSVIIGSNITNDINGATKLIAIGTNNTGNNITSASSTILLGSNTAPALTSGLRNILIGHETASNINTTNDMIVIGSGSASNISGNNGGSVIIGNNAGTDLGTGYSLLIGHEAGKNATGRDLLIFGNYAGRTVVGHRNLLLGNFTAGIATNREVNPMEGSDNMLFGNYAGYSLTTGNNNMVFGSGDASNGAAGYDLTSGDGNVLMGIRSGRNLTTGSYNLFIGRNSGYSVSASNRNFIMGDNAGYNLGANDLDPAYISNDNMILGNNAAYNLQIGNGLLVIGLEAGYLSENSLDNLYIGKRSGYSNRFGNECVYIGNQSGYLNTASQNTMIGTYAGRYSSTANKNTLIGYKAGEGKGESTELNNQGNQTVAIGFLAGSNIVTGYQSVLLGNNAGENNESGVKNIMIGPNAGINSTGSKNIFIGTSESNTTGIGQTTTGNFNIFMGVNAGVDNTTGAENTFIGSHAGNDNTTGSNNIFLGDDAGKNNTTGINNIKMGKQAGRDGLTSNNAVIIGAESGKLSNADKMISIGYQAGMENTAEGSIFIGSEAGKNNIGATGSIMIGAGAGLNNEQGNNHILIGQNAGRNINRTSDTLGDSIQIGSNAGLSMSNGIKNIIIGTEAMEQSSNASGSIAIGYRAGRNTGQKVSINEEYNNIIIGRDAVSKGDINRDNLAIGANVALNVDNEDKFLGNSMIGTDAGKNANLSINSVVLGKSGRIGTGGENNIIAGFQAGDNLGLTNFKKFTIAVSITRGLNYTYISDSEAINSEILKHIKLNNDVLITDGTNNLETTISGIEYDSDNTRTKITFTDFYDNETSIGITGKLFVIAKVDNQNTGFTDKSKSSSDTVIGNNAGLLLTEGSKNTAIGDNSMYNNKLGKYNNAFGVEAGYNLKTDNNTTLGTKAGYSLDSFIGDNSNISKSYNGFSISDNTLTIGTGSSYSNVTSNYNLTDVIELTNTSGNNGRYKIYDVTSNTITVEGLPKIDKLGVPNTIDQNSLIMNGANYNFSNINLNANTAIASKTYEIDSSNNTIYRQYSTIELSGSNIGSLFNSTYIIKISGSKYNDGVHYLYKDNSGFDDSLLRTYDILYPETFDANVTISSMSITANNLISANDTSSYNYSPSTQIGAFLGRTKGLTRIAYENNNYALNNYVKPINESILVDNINYGVDNYLNVIYATGFEEEYTINNDNTNMSTFEQFMINGNIAFDSTDNTITFNNSITLEIGTDSVYFISGDTLNNNNVTYFNIDSEVSFNNTKYKVTPLGTKTMVTESVVSNIFNPIYITKKNLNITSGESTILNDNSIVNMNFLSSLGSKVDGGAYIVENTGISNNKLNFNYNSMVPNLYDSFSNTTTQFNTSSSLSDNIKLNLINEPYITNYTAEDKNILMANDVFFQSFTIPDDGTFYATMSTRSITSNNSLAFRDLVAPCMIKINDEYYPVRSNKYPFMELEIDRDEKFFSTGPITGNIEVNSISLAQSSINFKNNNGYILEAAKQYKILGNEKNNDKTIYTVDNTDGITFNSAYLTSNSNIVTHNSFGRQMLLESVNSDYLDNENLTYGYGPGYFKRITGRGLISIRFPDSDLDNSDYLNEKILQLEPEQINQNYIYILPNESLTKYNILNLKYKNNIRFESVVSDIVDTFDGSNELNTITTLTSNFTLYGKEYNTFKISTYGYLLFEDNDNNEIITVNFLTRNYETKYIDTTRTVSNIKTKYLDQTFENDSIFLIDFNVNGNGKDGFNNCQLKLYLNNSTNYTGYIELNYSFINKEFYDLNLNASYQLNNIKYNIGLNTTATTIKENITENLTSNAIQVYTSNLDLVKNKKITLIPQNINTNYIFPNTFDNEFNLNNTDSQFAAVDNLIIDVSVSDSNFTYYKVNSFNLSNTTFTNSGSIAFDDSCVAIMPISNLRILNLEKNYLMFYADSFLPRKEATFLHRIFESDGSESNINGQTPYYGINAPYLNEYKISFNSNDKIAISKQIADQTSGSPNSFGTSKITLHDLSSYNYSLTLEQNMLNNKFELTTKNTNANFTAVSMNDYRILSIATEGSNIAQLNVNDITTFSNVYITSNYANITLTNDLYYSNTAPYFDYLHYRTALTDSNIACICVRNYDPLGDSSNIGGLFLYDLTTVNETEIELSNIKIHDSFFSNCQIHADNNILVASNDSLVKIYDISNLNADSIVSSVTTSNFADTINNSYIISQNNNNITRKFVFIETSNINGDYVHYMYGYNNFNNYKKLGEQEFKFDQTTINNSELILSTLTDNNMYTNRTNTKISLNSENKALVINNGTNAVFYDLNVSDSNLSNINSNAFTVTTTSNYSGTDMNKTTSLFNTSQSVLLSNITSYNSSNIAANQIEITGSVTFGIHAKLSDSYLCVSNNSGSNTSNIHLYNISTYDETTILDSETVLFIPDRQLKGDSVAGMAINDSYMAITTKYSNDNTDFKLYIYDLSVYDETTINNSNIQIEYTDITGSFGNQLELNGDLLAVSQHDSRKIHIYDLSTFSKSNIEASNITININETSFGEQISFYDNYLATRYRNDDNTRTISLLDTSNIMSSSIIESTNIVINNSDSEANDNFGIALKVNNNKLMASTFFNSNNSSSLYLYDITKKRNDNLELINGNYDIVVSNEIDINETAISEANIYVSNTIGHAGFAYISDESSNVLAIGMYDYSNYTVKTVLYDISSNDATTIKNSNIVLNDTFSGSTYNITLSMDNDNLVVGASEGSANIYLYNTSNFDSANIESSRLDIRDATGYSGACVKVFNNKIASSSPYNSDEALRAGVVRLFDISDKSNASVIEDTKLNIYSTDIAADRYFGRQIEMNDTYMIVSEFGELSNQYKVGNVYVYNISNFNETAIQNSGIKISLDDSVAGDAFGLSTKLYDTSKLIIGAPGDNSNVGAIHFFDVSSSNATQIVENKFTLTGTNTFKYGYSLDVKNDYLYVSSGIESNISNVFIYNLQDFDSSNITNTEIKIDTINTEITIPENQTDYMDSQNKIIATTNQNKAILTSYGQGFYMFDIAQGYKSYYSTGYTDTTSNLVTLTQSDLGANIFVSLDNFSNVEIKRDGQLLFRNNGAYQYSFDILRSEQELFDKLYYSVSSNTLNIYYELDDSVANAKFYLNDNTTKPGYIELQYYNIESNNNLSSNISIGNNTNYYNSISNTTIIRSFNYQIYTIASYLIENKLEVNDFIKFDPVSDHYNIFNEFTQVKSITYNGFNRANIVVSSNENINFVEDVSSDLLVNEYVGFDHTSNLARFDFENIRKMTGEHSNYLRFTKLRQDNTVDLFSQNELIHNNYPNLVIMDKSLNCSIDSNVFTSNNLFKSHITSKHVIPIKEPVPMEFIGDIGTITNYANIAHVKDNYAILLGEPVIDAVSNVQAQIENLNTQPKGFYDLFINNHDIDTTNNENIIFSSLYTSVVSGQTVTENADISITTTSFSGSRRVLKFDLGSTYANNPQNYGDILVKRKFGNVKNHLNLEGLKKLKPGNLITVYANDNYYMDTLEESTFMISEHCFDWTSESVIEIPIDKNYNNILLYNPTHPSDAVITVKIASFENNSTGSNVNITGQIINERINFNNFNNINSSSSNVIGPYNSANTFISLIDYPILKIKDDQNSIFNIGGVIPDWSLKKKASDNASGVSKMPTIDFSYDGNYIPNSQNVHLDHGFNTIIIRDNDIINNTNDADIRFVNSTQIDHNIIIDISSNTIRNDFGSSNIDFTEFNTGQLFRFYDSSENKNLIFKVDDIVEPTSISLTLDPTYETMNYNINYIQSLLSEGETEFSSTSANIYSNCIISKFSNSTSYYDTEITNSLNNATRTVTGAINIDTSTGIITPNELGSVNLSVFSNNKIIVLYDNVEDLMYATKIIEEPTQNQIITDRTFKYGNTTYNLYVLVNFLSVSETVYESSNLTIYETTLTDINENLADLSVYKQGDKIIVTNTENNNGTFTLTNGAISTDKCILLNDTLTNETAEFSLLQKVLLTSENGNYTNSNIALSSVDNSITLRDLTGQFRDITTSQELVISNTTNNNWLLNTTSTLGTNDIIYVDTNLVTENAATALIQKILKIDKLGEPLITLNNNKLSIFHYEDAQGNNLMLGSFTGQYCGSKNLAIHNTYIGNKVGQTNHGSGSILIGSETGLAVSSSDSETYYNNKLAIYKNNFIGVPSNPLIGGDFGTGRVGINTIDPDSLVSTGTLESDTRLVVNGGVRASSHSTFTGTHIIDLSSDVNIKKIKPGMCMVSDGKARRIGNNILDTIVKCRPSYKENDKKIYGVYSHFEIINNDIKVYVAAVGEGLMLVCDINGKIDNGDYVSTSNIYGLGQMQDDDLLHNYTVAKVTEDVNWNNNYYTITVDGLVYKVKLVSVTYHCG